MWTLMTPRDIPTAIGGERHPSPGCGVPLRTGGLPAGGVVVARRRRPVVVGRLPTIGAVFARTGVLRLAEVGRLTGELLRGRRRSHRRDERDHPVDAARRCHEARSGSCRREAVGARPCSCYRTPAQAGIN